jgi:hypothetical protein
VEKIGKIGKILWNYPVESNIPLEGKLAFAIRGKKQNVNFQRLPQRFDTYGTGGLKSR